MNRGAAAAALGLAAGVLALAGGCDGPWLGPRLAGGSPQRIQAPKPLDELLPVEIRLHEFTNLRPFGEDDNSSVLDVRVYAKDSFGENCRVFGQFRFELYHYKPTSADPKGGRIAVWNADVASPKANRRHWDMHRSYHFKLKLNRSLPAGSKYVLVATMDSIFTERLTVEKELLCQ